MQLQEIAPSIWRISTEVAGPAIAILGGTHGNERTGIEVVRQLVDDIQSGRLLVVRGTLFLVLGNLEAIEIQQRSSGNERDLNRMFTNDRFHLEPDGTYEDARAREIAELVLNHVDISIDIHSDNKPSVPFLACAATPAHEQIYRWFATDCIVTDPEFLLGGSPVTTDEYVDSRGGIGICYETGFASDTSRVKEVKENLLNILRDQAMLADQPVTTSPSKKAVYRIVDRIMFSEAGFRYAEGMGKESFQAITQGEIIGYVGDVPCPAKQNCCLIFPKPEHLFWKGTPVTWIAVRVEDQI